MALTLQQWIKDFSQKRCLKLDFSPALSSLDHLSVRSCTWHTCMEGWNTSVRSRGSIFTLLHVGEAWWEAEACFLTEGPNVWISNASFLCRQILKDRFKQLFYRFRQNRKKVRQGWSWQDPGHLFGWAMGARLCSCSFTMSVLTGI